MYRAFSAERSEEGSSASRQFVVWDSNYSFVNAFFSQLSATKRRPSNDGRNAIFRATDEVLLALRRQRRKACSDRPAQLTNNLPHHCHLHKQALDHRTNRQLRLTRMNNVTSTSSADDASERQHHQQPHLCRHDDVAVAIDNWLARSIVSPISVHLSPCFVSPVYVRRAFHVPRTHYLRRRLASDGTVSLGVCLSAELFISRVDCTLH